MSKEHSNRVAKHFAQRWDHYDLQIRAVVPFYDEMLSTVIAISKHTVANPINVLEIGVGTGYLTQLVAAAFPQAKITGMDIVQDFLRIAEERLSGYGARIRLKHVDITEFEFVEKYDLVITSLVFHHLKDKVKIRLYSDICRSMKGGGCLINADFVDSASRYYGQIFDRLRIELMRRAGCSEHEIQEKYIEHRNLEIPVPLEVQLAWLRDAGFTDVECYWKYLNLAAFGGRKAQASNDAHMSEPIEDDP